MSKLCHPQTSGFGSGLQTPTAAAGTPSNYRPEASAPTLSGAMTPGGRGGGGYQTPMPMGGGYRTPNVGLATPLRRRSASILHALPSSGWGFQDPQHAQGCLRPPSHARWHRQARGIRHTRWPRARDSARVALRQVGGRARDARRATKARREQEQ